MNGPKSAPASSSDWGCDRKELIVTMQAKLYSYFLLLMLTLSIVACNLVVTPPPPSQINPNGVIFTAEQTNASLDAIWPEPTDTWTPSEADVAALEADLPAYLETAENQWLQDDPPIVERVPDYMRQYLGIVENKQQIVYANFFCTIDQINWHNEFVLVMDGGDCYFQVKYNPQTGEFFDFVCERPKLINGRLIF